MSDILDQLQMAASGLWVISETDAALEIVDLGKVEQAGFSTNNLLQVLSLPPDTAIETQEVTYFFRNMTKAREGASEEKIQEAKRFQELVELLSRQLKDVKAYRIGQTRIDAYLLGWTNDDQLIG
ncbi:nuclease A inhibitor family protein, partial [Rufibacter sp. H-1]